MTTVADLEEKKTMDSGIEEAAEEAKKLAPEGQALAPNDAAGCDDVLETMDSCVSCVEGVGLQSDFEDKHLDNTLHLIDRSGSLPQSHQSLSSAEAALIRLQIQENSEDSPGSDKKNESKKQSVLTTTSNQDKRHLVPDLETVALTLCCSDNADIDDSRHVTAASVPALSAGTSSTPAAAAAAEVSPDAKLLQNEASDQQGSSTLLETNADPLQCAICFDEAVGSSRRITFAKLPCCGHSGTEETSSVKICTACILVLTTQTSNGQCRVGRCPRCRSWIVVQTPQSGAAAADSLPLEIRTVAAAGQCRICNQVKDQLVDENESVCDACFFGRRHPLLYECQQCRVTQRIPHPMYRYQEQPDQFGNITWACQGACQNFTKWRIRPDQLSLIPVGDAPQSWDGELLDTARTRVLQARRELSGAVNEQESTQGGCVVL